MLMPSHICVIFIPTIIRSYIIAYATHARRILYKDVSQERHLFKSYFHLPQKSLTYEKKIKRLSLSKTDLKRMSERKKRERETEEQLTYVSGCRHELHAKHSMPPEDVICARRKSARSIKTSSPTAVGRSS